MASTTRSPSKLYLWKKAQTKPPLVNKVDVLEGVNPNIVKIYTDWANHYLEKAGKKRCIRDLQHDMQDSTLLVDVLEAVTNQKVPGVNAKVKSGNQSIENVAACLAYLTKLGVEVEGIQAKDIRDGHLKSVLGLFFSLSRFKQQQKQQQQQQATPPTPHENMSTKLPSPFKRPANGVAGRGTAASPKPSFMKPPDPVQGSKTTHHDHPPKKPKASSAIPAPGGRSGLKPPSGHSAAKESKLSAPPPQRSNLPAPGSATSSLPRDSGPMLDKFKFFGNRGQSADKTPPSSGLVSQSGLQTPSPATSSTAAASKRKSSAPNTSRLSNSSSGVSSATSTVGSASRIGGVAKASSNSSLVSSRSNSRSNIAGSRTNVATAKKTAPCRPSPKSARRELVPPSSSRSQPVSAPTPPPTTTIPVRKGVQPPAPPKRDDKTSLSSRQKQSTATELSSDSAYGDSGGSSTYSSELPNNVLPKSLPAQRQPPVGAADNQKPTMAVKGTAIDAAAAEKEPDQQRIIPGAADRPVKTSPSESMAPTDVCQRATPEPRPQAISSPLPEQKKLTSPRVRSTSPVNIGVVSPMTHHKQVPACVESSFDTGHVSDASNTSSSGDTASVIYCPNGEIEEESVKRRKEKKERKHRTQSKIETTFETNDSEPVTKRVDLSPQEDSKDLEVDDVDEAVNIQPMEPLIRAGAYASIRTGLTLGNAPSIGHSLMLRRHLGSNYSPLQLLSAGEVPGAVTSQAITAGYVSDTDMLAGPQPMDPAGYVSEGGISLYVQRMRARFKEGLEIARDTMRKDTMGDSFEDSSSLSSEVSENIEEVSTDDLTGSSLSDNQFVNALKLCPYPGLPVANQKTAKSARPAQGQGVQGQGQRSRKVEQSQGASQAARPKSESMQSQMSRPQQYENSSFRASPPRQPATSGPPSSQNGRPSQIKSPVVPVTGIPRPGSNQGQAPTQPTPQPGQYSSLSLDRKRVVLSHFTPELTSYEGEGFYHIGNGVSPSTLAMVSPRHTLTKGGQHPPSMSGDYVMHGGGHDVRMRHSLAGNGNHHPAPSQPAVANGNSSMSRSMVDSMKQLSNKDGRATTGRLSIPPQQVLQEHTAAWNGHPQYAALMAAQGLPRSGSSRSCKSESPYASLITRTGDRGSASPRYKTGTGQGYGVKSDYGVSSPGRIVAPVQPFTPTSGPYGPPLGHADGSQWSLASSASVHNEERYQAEIRKLSREIDQYKEKVQTLISQQSTYDSVVSAFEHSLEAMKRRLHTLMSTSEQKDQELADVHQTLHAMYDACRSAGLPVDSILSPHVTRRQSSEPAVSMKSVVEPKAYLSLPTAQPVIVRSHGSTPPPGALTRQLSNESMNSLMSQRSTVSNASSNPSNTPKLMDKKAKKSWVTHGLLKEESKGFQLRSSFSRAFKGKARPNSKGPHGGSLSDVEEDSCPAILRGRSQPNSPMHTPRTSVCPNDPMKRDSCGSTLSESNEADLVLKLKKELEIRDNALTDLRLEALTAAHQLDEVKEELNQVKSRVGNILPCGQPLGDSQLSLDANGGITESKLSLSDRVDMGHLDNMSDGTPLRLVVDLEYHGDPHRFLGDFSTSTTELAVALLRVSSRMKWSLLDSVIEKSFREAVMRIDPVSSLGLSPEAIAGYALGKTLRAPGLLAPQLMPADLLGTTNGTALRLALKGVKQNSTDCLVFDTLIPKNNMQRLTSAVIEQKRIILNGPSGTGKSYLAQKLANYLVARHGRDPADGCVMHVELNTNASSLKQTLTEVATKVVNSNGNIDSPLVIVIDNLHVISDLADSFSPLLNVSRLDCPYILATTHATACTTALQVHHGFRVVLWGNHMEPVRGFLGRYLRRKLLTKEVEEDARCPELRRVVDWLPKIWDHMNKFLEHVSRTSDVTIGPKIFLSFPLDVNRSRDWFIELWNHSIVPYMLETAKESRKVNGQLLSPAHGWENPVEEVARTWPWTAPPDVALTGIRAEDVGAALQPPTLHPPPPLKTKSSSAPVWTRDEDPLIQLLRLREQQAEEDAGRDGVSAC